MKIIDENISITELKSMADKSFGNFVKAVADIENKIMVVDAELHADEEALLLEKGSQQENLWGINIYPAKTGRKRIEYDSMINLRPKQDNMSRSVEEKSIREKIYKVVDGLIDNG